MYRDTEQTVAAAAPGEADGGFGNTVALVAAQDQCYGRGSVAGRQTTSGRD